MNKEKKILMTEYEVELLEKIRSKKEEHKKEIDDYFNKLDSLLTILNKKVEE